MARPPRRRFAAPLVLTVAACGSPKATPATTPPAETAERPRYAEDYAVSRIEGDVCEANMQNFPADFCGDDPSATCNPPIPMAVACPEGMVGDEARVALPYDSLTCVLVTPPACTDDCTEAPVGCLHEVADPRFDEEDYDDEGSESD